MAENFASAAARHLDDAQILLGEHRFDNAAYLAGYVAECALKVLLISPAPSPKAVGHDLSVLTTDALRMLWLFAPAMKRYTVPQTADVLALIQQWNPEMRYGATGDISDLDANHWVSGATQLFNAVVAQLVLDGWSTLQ